MSCEEVTDFRRITVILPAIQIKSKKSIRSVKKAETSFYNPKSTNYKNVKVVLHRSLYSRVTLNDEVGVPRRIPLCAGQL